MSSYVVISPVKDEQAYIGATIESMCAQTVRPVRWIIVDDGSADATVEYIEKHALQHDWITLIRLPRRGRRGAGSPVVHAFNIGFEKAKRESFDFVVKLDGDLRIPPTYFEKLLGRFEQDPKLGIASGIYLEEQPGGWKPVSMPDYHAAGACKVIRARCFEEIGGFVGSRGWDTVDEIRAQTLGWRTCHFSDLTFEHLRIEGSSRGPLYTSQLHGEVYYLTGGPFSFLLIKALHRMVAGKPPVLGGVMLLAGYFGPMLKGRERLVTKSEAKHYQKTLKQRMWSAITSLTHRAGLRMSTGRQA